MRVYDGRVSEIQANTIDVSSWSDVDGVVLAGITVTLRGTSFELVDRDWRSDVEVRIGQQFRLWLDENPS